MEQFNSIFHQSGTFWISLQYWLHSCRNGSAKMDTLSYIYRYFDVSCYLLIPVLFLGVVVVGLVVVMMMVMVVVVMLLVVLMAVGLGLIIVTYN